jgi:hypothetical protein
MSKEPTDRFIKREADRLLTLPAAPADSTELARALKRHGRTEYHVTAIVQHLLDCAQFCPAPAAIREAAEASLDAPPPKFRAVNPECPACHGRGWVVSYVGQYSGAKVCECRETGAGA